MDKTTFNEAVHDYADTAFANALVFEHLAAAYNAIATGRFEDWQNLLIKIQDLPKDNPTLVRVREALEVICDDGTNFYETTITGELSTALTPQLEG